VVAEDDGPEGLRNSAQRRVDERHNEVLYEPAISIDALDCYFSASTQVETPDDLGRTARE